MHILLNSIPELLILLFIVSNLGVFLRLKLEGISFITSFIYYFKIIRLPVIPLMIYYRRKELLKIARKDESISKELYKEMERLSQSRITMYRVLIVGYRIVIDILVEKAKEEDQKVKRSYHDNNKLSLVEAIVVIVKQKNEINAHI